MKFIVALLHREEKPKVSESNLFNEVDLSNNKKLIEGKKIWNCKYGILYKKYVSDSSSKAFLSMLLYYQVNALD